MPPKPNLRAERIKKLEDAESIVEIFQVLETDKHIGYLSGFLEMHPTDLELNSGFTQEENEALLVSKLNEEQMRYIVKAYIEIFPDGEDPGSLLNMMHQCMAVSVDSIIIAATYSRHYFQRNKEIAIHTPYAVHILHRLLNNIQILRNAEFFIKRNEIQKAHQEYISGLTETLSTFNKFVSIVYGKESEHVVPNNFAELILTLVRPYGAIGVHIEIKTEVRELLIKDEFKKPIGIIIWNLVNNAWKYSGAAMLSLDMPAFAISGEANVNVSVFIKDEFISVNISDKGALVSQGQWEQMLTGEGVANSNPAVFSSGSGFREIMAAFEQIGDGTISLCEAEPPFTKSIEVRLPMSIFKE